MKLERGYLLLVSACCNQCSDCGASTMTARSDRPDWAPAFTNKSI